jgi:probable rRNA maturation factor
VEMAGADRQAVGAPKILLNVPSNRPIPSEFIDRALRRLLSRVGVEGGELSVTFLEDEPIRVMNRTHLGHDWIPDVLSFSLHAAAEPLLGDVYVGLDQAERQAREHKVSREEELVRLALHGTLHTLGYDHPEAPDERAGTELYQLQEAILEELGFGGERPPMERGHR